ncbi:DHH family phosphoesterase [Natronocalculus amylovorans]|uniref:OB-fold nucleic acid binding domain-containing protein n=1 Tax=Natronocalculus amylovorans TaxID=2917812 RepID=A0AAE3K931_9EURY|nr:OB-fold nucleic acid binding domain-containing protein [Natronocalculus amylovorans]MCL9817947.1 OB-fold nucleic acid binding domain-containing protein [Natronocalculus amylovorans]
MGSCIICGTPVDGHICDSHQEDVVFEFRGNHANQLRSGRFYRGVVDGYADFGVFIDIAPGVTGLLHRSELDRRLESLDWEPGDTVCVQVKNVRDNGNIDLGWSIRQSNREFRGALIQDGTKEYLPEEFEDADEESEASESESESATSVQEEKEQPSESEPEPEPEPQSTAPANTADGQDESEPEPEPGQLDRVTVDSLSDRVGETVRLEGEIVSARQTGGPTVFELRDETGVVDCAAFVEPGVRAYPDIDVDSIVRLDGEVEMRRGDLQVETEALVALESNEQTEVQTRLSDALSDRARPEALKPLADNETVVSVAEGLLDAAEVIRTAVLESRPIVVRHGASADGYVAGAALEHAVLPLIREEHARSDAEYHYFTRRPLDDSVYGMDAATNDATRMLQDRDRHDEKIPLFIFLGTASTVESEDGLGLLGIYGAERLVIDAGAVDSGILDAADLLVTPDKNSADDRNPSTGSLAANVAAAINEDVRDDVGHLPAISYWEDTPQAYTELADSLGYDDERVANLRAAIALEAYYQSYQDKRELVTDLLFEDAGGLADHIAEQFDVKLETEFETAIAHLETEERDGVTLAVLDTDAYTHRFDFPPTGLLLDEIHRRERDEGPFVTIGVGMDELFIRSTDRVDIRAVASDTAVEVGDADVTALGVREGRIEFLSGRRDQVSEAVLDAIAAQLS